MIMLSELTNEEMMSKILDFDVSEMYPKTIMLDLPRLPKREHFTVNVVAFSRDTNKVVLGKCISCDEEGRYLTIREFPSVDRPFEKWHQVKWNDVYQITHSLPLRHIRERTLKRIHYNYENKQKVEQIMKEKRSNKRYSFKVELDSKENRKVLYLDLNQLMKFIKNDPRLESLQYVNISKRDYFKQDRETFYEFFEIFNDELWISPQLENIFSKKRLNEFLSILNKRFDLECV